MLVLYYFYSGTLFALFMLITASSDVLAHPGVSTVALVKVSPTGHISVTVRVDALAFAVGEPSLFAADESMLALLNGPELDLHAAMDAARRHFEQEFVLQADGGPVAARLEVWPRAEDLLSAKSAAGGSPRLPIKLDYVVAAEVGVLPRTVAIGFPMSMGGVVITVDRPTLEPVALPLDAGEVSPAIEVGPGTANRETDSARPPVSSPQDRDAATTTVQVAQPFLRFLKMGFVHIIPLGLDHILFVVGLYLLSTSVRSLLVQVTAFTVAHSVTLALTMMGTIDVSSRFVEPLIAISIVLVAVENIATRRVHPWRPALVFVFGLVHGMGFAGVLREAELPRGQMAGALVAFNIGVEIGQLAVIAAAMALVGWFRDRDWYRARIVIPASALIGCVAAWWVVERLLG